MNGNQVAGAGWSRSCSRTAGTTVSERIEAHGCEFERAAACSEQLRNLLDSGAVSLRTATPSMINHWRSSRIVNDLSAASGMVGRWGAGSIGKGSGYVQYLFGDHSALG